MKKTLLLAAMSLMILAGYAQSKVWNFTEMYPSAAVKGGTAAQESGTVDLLTFNCDPEKNGGKFAIDYSKKAFPAGGSFTAGDLLTRFKLGGAGSTAESENKNMPSKNYIAFSVSGNSTITVHYRCGNGSPTDGRELYITDGTNLLANVKAANDDASVLTANYVGGPATIYVYSYINSYNLYRVEATSVIPPSSVENTLSESGVYFNGAEIINDQNLNLQVYNTLGKLVRTSNTNIAVSSLESGIYIVRAEGIKGAIKIHR